MRTEARRERPGRPALIVADALEGRQRANEYVSLTRESRVFSLVRSARSVPRGRRGTAFRARSPCW
jgi:hypothetical protein